MFGHVNYFAHNYEGFLCVPLFDRIVGEVTGNRGRGQGAQPCGTCSMNWATGVPRSFNRCREFDVFFKQLFGFIKCSLSHK